jgi:hypothetical protein
MPRETFFKRTVQIAEHPLSIEAAINFDEATFGVSTEAVASWTISISDGQRDIGRLVGFEGEGQKIISMHRLKPDPSALRAVEITVFRVDESLRTSKSDAAIFGAFERWLLKRGWRGNLVKKLIFTSAQQVVPIRRFWLDLGFELVLGEEGKWDEHAVKRWR